MYFGRVKVTFREVLVSIIIIFTLGAVGIFIDTKITDNFIENNNVYHKSVKIKDKDSLGYLKQTKVGNSLIEGDFQTSDGVTFEEINGKYTYIEKVKEKYTMYTRTVCSGSGKNRHCRVETYWTWDRVDSEEKFAKNINFYGNKLNTKYVVNQISEDDLDLEKNISDKYKKDVKGNYLYESSRIRYYFEYIPLNFRGTIFTSFTDENKSFKEYEVNYNKTIDQLLYDEENAVNSGGIIFRVVWLIIIGGIVYLYVANENEYLED